MSFATNGVDYMCARASEAASDVICARGTRDGVGLCDVVAGVASATFAWSSALSRSLVGIEG